MQVISLFKPFKIISHESPSINNQTRVFDQSSKQVVYHHDFFESHNNDRFVFADRIFNEC
jgi:hypothetical protein